MRTLHGAYSRRNPLVYRLVRSMSRRAICRINVKTDAKHPLIARERQGTGFLFAKGKVLTAAHVVKSFVVSSNKFEGKISVRFFREDGTLDPEQEATIEDFLPDEDFAVLDCPQAPDAAALSLRRLSDGYLFSWATLGFPLVASNEGKELSGTTFPPRYRIQLTSNVKAGEAGGFSGAPLLVDGQVAALIVEALDATNSETLFAIDLARIAELSASVRGVFPAYTAPYVDHVQFRLTGLGSLLKSSSQRLKLGAVAEDEQRVRPIAEAMMRGGVPETYSVLYELRQALAERKPSIAELLLELSAEVWIDGGAVAKLTRHLKRATRPHIAVVSATLPKTGQAYAQRARCHENNYPGLGTQQPLDVERGQAGLWLARFEAALCRELDCDASELTAKLEDEPLDDNPIVFVIPPPLPVRLELEEIWNANPLYQGVRLLLVVGADDLADAINTFPEAVLIEPHAHTDFELKASQDLNKYIGFWRRELRKLEKANGG